MERADLAESIDILEQRMDSIEQRLDASYTSLSTQILLSRRENEDAHLAMRTEFTQGMSGLREELETMRTEAAGEFAAMRTEVAGEFAAMRTEVAGEFAAMRTEIAGQSSAMQAGTSARFEKLEAALADGLGENRRFMLVLHEDLLSRIALLGEGRLSSS